ncbi:MAG: hypothetical protein AAGE94_13560 [Acidobacteriota bacterium]
MDSTPASPTGPPPADRWLLGLDIAFTVGMGAIVVGGRLLVDAWTSTGFAITAIGAAMIAGSLVAQPTGQPVRRAIAILMAILSTGLFAAAIVA